jgi:hypothetical protein
MRPIRIVMVTPRFNLAPRVEQIEEPTNLQTLFAQPPVETFHVRVFHRLTGRICTSSIRRFRHQ